MTHGPVRIPRGGVAGARPSNGVACKAEPTERDPTRKPERDARQGDRPPGQRLVCARCGATITHEHARIQMNGRHEHVCANPHGVAFYIGCFAAAPGCLGVGPRHSEFSWFPGYLWQIAVCHACHTHLGWRFTAGAAMFLGLILDRLRAADDPGA